MAKLRMIRKATPADIEMIVALGIEALSRGAYPNLVISHGKVYAMARQCISSAQNFSWVAERDGKVVGAVSALVHECTFHEGQKASVVQVYTTVPGEGIKLVRAFLRWARARPAIKMISFTLEHDADPRIGTMLRRLGVGRELRVFLESL